MPCESGWDFSSRWCKAPDQLGTIHTTDMVQVDLNCLLYHLEDLLSNIFKGLGESEREGIYRQLADSRKNSIDQYFWWQSGQFYHDYDFVLGDHTPSISAAAVYPLFFGLSTDQQARAVASKIERHLLRDGGLLTTNFESGQQWDAPNGWAPLQWMAIKGLRNYGYDALANRIKTRWVDLNTKVFKNTGKLMEKYNVVDTNLSSGGGEYPVQDGFGWTNGVLLKLISE